MYFEALLALETGLCTLLIAATARRLGEIAPTPEVELARRAFVAARFGMNEAEALGPLFRHLSRAARGGLREAHRLQERVRGQRERPVLPGRLVSLTTVLRPRAARSSEELAELSHLVEQLEQLACAIARYRAGIGMLGDMRVPLKCLQAQSRTGGGPARRPAANR